jgi:hypothetical protein
MGKVCPEECTVSYYQAFHISRRRFLKQISLAGAAATLPVGAVSALGKEIAAAASGSVVRNRAPLSKNAFYPLPLGSIKPAGWLRAQLQIQADGLGGHLDETWPDVGPNSGWLGGTGESWERGPYFLDGLTPLAYLLDDAHLKAKAQRYIGWTIDSQHDAAIF